MIDRLWRMAGWLGVTLTFVVSLTPPVLEESRAHSDKLVHLAGYAVMMFWWAQVVLRHRWRLAVMIILLGVAIELLQGLTPNRQPDPLDALANTIGVLLGWFVARLVSNLPERLAFLLPALRR